VKSNFSDLSTDNSFQSRPAMSAQSNGPPHMRRESSQSSNQGFQPNGGRGRGFQPQQPYNQSPQPYRALPNQPMGGRGMPPAFTPQGLQNSPYRNQRPSPAMAPAQMHQQQHFANPQGQPFYPGQQYPQPVRNPPQTSNFSGSESSQKISFSPTTRPFRSFPSPQQRSMTLTGLGFQAPDDDSNAFLRDVNFSSFTPPQHEQFLTTLQQQNMYGMPPQGLDPYNNYYAQPAYGLQQSIHYPGVPNRCRIPTRCPVPTASLLRDRACRVHHRRCLSAHRPPSLSLLPLP
jgi:translation initiation factor 4G